MKLMVLFLLLAGITACERGKGYVIEANITGIPDSTEVCLVDFDGSLYNTVARDTVVGGRFRFSGISEKTPYRLEITAGNSGFIGNCVVWVGNGRSEITGTGKNMIGWDVTSAMKEQQEENRYRRATFEKQTKCSELSAEISSNFHTGNTVKQDSLLRLLNSLVVDVCCTNLQMIGQSPLSEVAIHYLHYVAVKMRYFRNTPFTEKTMPDGEISETEVFRQYERMDSTMKKSSYGQEIETALNPPTVPKVGDEMADAGLHDIDGVSHRLSDYKGKYILLDFWSRGCGPCLKAIPELSRCAELYKDSLVIISISLDKKGFEAATRQKNITWVSLTDGMGSDAGVGAKYGVTAMPCFYLINPEGRVATRWRGYGEGLIEMKLATFLALP